MHHRVVGNLLGYIVLSAVCLGGFLPILNFAPDLVLSRQAAVPDEVRKLMTQRRDVLQLREKTLNELYKAGELGLDAVLRSRDQLWEAELQLAESTEQRVAICEKKVENMRKLEETIKLQFNQGEGQYEAVLEATAARLQAEIDLARERM